MTNTMLPTKPILTSTCEWCGAACLPHDATCSIRCEGLLLRHEKETARAVLRDLKQWRLHRGRKGTPGEGSMSRIAATVDRLLKEDRARRKMLTTARQQKDSQ